MELDIFTLTVYKSHILQVEWLNVDGELLLSCFH